MIDCKAIDLMLLGIVAGIAGYAAAPYLLARGVYPRWPPHYHLWVCLAWLVASLGVWVAISGWDASATLLIGVRVALGALFSISLAWALALICIPQPCNQLEHLVQARTAHLQSVNERLAAELLACQTSAATLAAEHARLLEQAKEMAAAAERARLARDLHDSVTQTIYSASLIVQVLPAVWQRNPSEGERNLIKLRQLVHGALAEMRALLFELRPAALEAANLGVLLQQLGDVLTGHTRIPVSVTIDGAAELPIDVKITVYRIAQEAFNNIAKHAGATQAAVSLHLSATALSLQVRDNGRGFDPATVPGERMGVRIMTERALGVNAHFRVTSAPGQGATVSLQWPDPGTPQPH